MTTYTLAVFAVMSSAAWAVYYWAQRLAHMVRRMDAPPMVTSGPAPLGPVAPVNPRPIPKPRHFANCGAPVTGSTCEYCRGKA